MQQCFGSIRGQFEDGAGADTAAGICRSIEISRLVEYQGAFRVLAISLIGTPKRIKHLKMALRRQFENTALVRCSAVECRPVEISFFVDCESRAAGQTILGRVKRIECRFRSVRCEFENESICGTTELKQDSVPKMFPFLSRMTPASPSWLG